VTYSRLAVAAGLTVATTAGAQNATYVKDLGATHWFDHKDENVVEQILKVLKPGDVVFDAIGVESSQKAAATIVKRLGGGIFAVSGLPLPTGFDNVKGAFGMFVESCSFWSVLLTMLCSKWT
jgi:NADPH:quinone reductase-like Zn-dependent oxidoreductase